MWGITKVTDESDWFERYVRLALSVQPPSLPAKRHKLGATSVQWFETEPGVAFIDARGGSTDDRVLATQYMKAMLAGHGYRVAQYEVDHNADRLPQPEVDRLYEEWLKHPCPKCGAKMDDDYLVGPECTKCDFTVPSAWYVGDWDDNDGDPHDALDKGDPRLPRLNKTAKWGDIMAKAKRLIQSGKVQLLRNGANNIVGSVIGDHGTYQTEISREDPNSQAITQWQCDCPWDQYAWQRTRQWKKYEGRPCAHVLATFWKSQASPIDEDAHPAMQVTQQPSGQPMPPTIPGQTFGPGDPMEQGTLPGLPGGAPLTGPATMPYMPGPGQAMGTPPQPGLPPEVLPPFPMEGQMEPQPPQVSIPGAKPQSPLNPVQWPGGTLSSSGWDTQVFSASPFNQQPEGFANGNMVQIIGTDMGVAEGKDPNNPMHGQYLDIKSSTRGLGEVLGMDTVPGMGQMVEVIFPLDKTGPMQPYHIRAWLRPDQLRLRPDIQRPGPMIRRRRER
jgi:hypothetical protein